MKNAHNTSNSDEIYEAVTKVFSDMFTWIPFEKHLTPDLLQVLMPLGRNEVYLNQFLLKILIVKTSFYYLECYIHKHFDYI